MIHAHMTAWFLAVVLFFIALGLHKSGKQKGFKVLQMIIRVMYILILVTGGMMIFDLYQISGGYIAKALAGLAVIGLIEMILGGISKGKKTGALWIAFAVAFALVLYLGFSLPMGTDLF